MKKGTRSFLWAIVLWSLSGAGLAYGQRQSPDQPVMPKNVRFGDPNVVARNFQDYLYGVVKNIGKQELVLDKTRFGVPKEIALTRKTKYVRNGKASSLEQLKVGDDVFVETKKGKKTGELVAKKVLSGVNATGSL